METAPDSDDEISGWAQALGLQAGRGTHELDPLMRLLSAASGWPTSALWIVDGPRNQFVAAHGLASRAIPSDIPGGSRLAELAFQRGQVVMVDAAAPTQVSDPDPLMSALDLTHFAGLAVYGPGRLPIGVLCVMDRDASRASARDARLRDALHDARDLLEAHLRLRADALHDPASGALARRPFVELADREWRRAMRGLHAIGIVVASLDRFDALITEGQAAINRAVRAAVVAMQYSAHRPGDVVCRYDERRFVLMLPGTDRKGAAATAERFREALEALRIPLQDGSTLTLSAAVHLVPTDTLSRGNLASAVDAASQALHAAQADGANRWVLASQAQA